MARLIRRASGAFATAALLGAVSVAGIGVAYWRTSGTGLGRATVAGLEVITEDISAEQVSAALIPGESADLVVKITSRASSPIRITGFTVGAPVVDNAHAGCPSDAVTTNVDRTTNAALDAYLQSLSPIAPQETRSLLLPATASMRVDAPTQCQGATFTFPIGVKAS